MTGWTTMDFRRIRYKFTLIYFGGLIVLSCIYLAANSRLVTNDTISLPEGEWLRLPLWRTPQIGGVYEFTISNERLTLAKKFGYHGDGTFLKKLVAKGGDLVTINSDGVLINGKYLTNKGIENARNINLYPIESMNYKLSNGEYFFIGLSAHSYDSRYFGIIKETQIKYRNVLLWKK